MEVGKLANDVLEKIVINNIVNKREEVVVGSGLGEDNAILDLGGDLCVLSTDPITGASQGLGRLAVNISCNDIAASGAEPIAILLTILAPRGTGPDEIELIMREANQEAQRLNIEIAGGHTEITDAVNRMVLTTTAIGRQTREGLPKKEGIRPGDRVLITKSIGLEGTAILAGEREDFLLGRMSKEELEEARALADQISVVKEGRILGQLGVGYMHDITEGGVLGALWEAGQAINMGLEVYEEKIPILDLSRKLAELLEIDPYRLISSGSMLVIMARDKVDQAVARLKEEDIDLVEIGQVAGETSLIRRKGAWEEILAPASDQLYKGLDF